MIVDAHVHLFDPTRPQGVPWPAPDSGIYRPALPDGLREVALPVGVQGAVCVESSRWIDDNAWVLNLAEKHPFILAVVGYLDLGDARFQPLLARFASHPLFRGIRVRPIEPLDFRLSGVRRNLEAVASHGMTLDILAADPAQARTYATVAREWAGIRFMLDHMAHPSIDGGKPDGPWREAIREFRDLPNVWCKISRLTEAARTQPAPMEASYYTPWLDVLWDVFGADRLAFGSNWPPCLKAGDYCTTVTLTRDYLRSREPGTIDRVLHRNAAAFYGGPRFQTPRP